MRQGLLVLFGAIVIFMSGLAVFTSIKSNVFHLPQPVVQEPWFQATLVDFYFNILLISSVVIYKESSWRRSALWIIAFILLGSIATCSYAFLQVLSLKPGEGLEGLFKRRA